MIQATELRGVVHGKTIELTQETGLPDGQTVTVKVLPVVQETSMAPGEGLKRSFGAWAEDAEALDESLEWNRRQRKIGRREIEP